MEPEGPSDDQAHPPIESLDPRVRETEADRGEDPVAVLTDGSAGLDERLESGALHAGPAVDSSATSVSVRSPAKMARALPCVGRHATAPRRGA